MKLSVSIIPDSLFAFGVEQIVKRGYATEAQMLRNPKKAWSRYVQALILEDMQRTPGGAPKKLRRLIQT